MIFKIFRPISITVTLLAAKVVCAEEFTGSFTNPLTGKPGGGTDKGLSEMIDGVLGFLLGAAVLICPAFIIWGGFLIATAGGNEQKVKEGKQYITYAAVGFIIIALSSAIKAIVFDIAGS